MNHINIQSLRLLGIYLTTMFDFKNLPYLFLNFWLLNNKHFPFKKQWSEKSVKVGCKKSVNYDAFLLAIFEGKINLL